MHALRALITSHEEWLMGRILRYAKERDYTRYTSTLEEAWRLSIQGLTDSLVGLIEAEHVDLEFSPDDDYRDDPAARFGILEARKHRERGIELGMFLGLMKYYRQSYKDLVLEEGSFGPEDRTRHLHAVERFFDRVELAFCVEWSTLSEHGKLEELRATNRLMTNEKNRYLTVFESMANPVLLLDEEGTVENMNRAAASLFADSSVPGAQYYRGEAQVEAVDREESPRPPVEQFLPWLTFDLNAFRKSDERERGFDREVPGEQGGRFFHVKLSRMLDYSAKFSGTIVWLENVTERKRLEMELERLATTDSLTGACNRYHFWQIARREIGRARRYEHPLSLLLLDIDFFKLINDTHGHQAGDVVLETLVKSCRNMLRDSDVVGRLGGEEFGILLAHTPATHAEAVAERMRRMLGALVIEVDEAEIRFTVSIGVTTLIQGDEHVEDLLKRADLALYRAKRGGRNRTAVAESWSTAP